MKRLARLRYDLLLAIWPLGKHIHRLSRLPLLGPFVAGRTCAETNEAIILAPRTVAVQHKLGDTENVTLPYPLLAPLVEQASARAILNECPCRRAERCATYPRELGCLFLGNGAARIQPNLGRSATQQEALDHVSRAMDVGLVPTILHSSFDAYLLDIPYRRMLAVCFCCDCCCTVRHSLRVDAPGFRDTVIRLPGLTVEVNQACTGCGACLPTCPVQAISLQTPSQRHAQAQIDAERCKGCGRCVATCPIGAIHLHLSDHAETLGLLVDRISQRTDIWAAPIDGKQMSS